MEAGEEQGEHGVEARLVVAAPERIGGSLASASAMTGCLAVTTNIWAQIDQRSHVDFHSRHIGEDRAII